MQSYSFHFRVTSLAINLLCRKDNDEFIKDRERERFNSYMFRN